VIEVTVYNQADMSQYLKAKAGLRKNNKSFKSKHYEFCRSRLKLKIKEEI